MTKVLELQHLVKTFTQGGELLTLWQDLSLSLKSGEIVALIGESGAGKTTLLQVAGLLERPTSGEIVLMGQACSSLSERVRTAYRRKTLGFVYQYHLLLPEFTALENVVIPQLIAGASERLASERAKDLLVSLGLKHRLTHRPNQLSGGEQQRVAIARALANKPRVVLADEPTGNLDSHTAEGVFQELLRIVREENVTALIATHNQDLARQMDRVLELRAGSIV